MKRRDLLKLAGAATGLSLIPGGTLAGIGASPAAAAVAPAAPTLPQHDSLAAQLVRTAALRAHQATCSWTESAPNVPGVPMASGLTANSAPTIEWLLLALPAAIDLILNLVTSAPLEFAAATTTEWRPLQDELESMGARVDAVAGAYDALVAANAGAVPPRPAILAKLARLEQTLGGVVTQLGVVVPALLSLMQQVAADSRTPSAVGDLARYEALFATMPVSPLAEDLHDDAVFAYLRVGGPNPMVIRRVSGTLPAKFPLTNAEYRQVMGASDSLSAAIAQRRLYLADYAELGAMAPPGVTTKPLTGKNYNSAPIALFAVPPGGGPLEAVAIQCGQDPHSSARLLRPAAGDTATYWSWQLAKTVVQTADFNHHEMLVHLARTHLVSEAFCVATTRHLAPTHPLNVLLMPHFEGDLFINELAALIIMGEEHFADIILAAPIAAITATAGEARLDWDFYANMPPADFAARGVDDTTALPDYPYRDDALLLWETILAWVRDYIAVYYASDHDVAADTELSAWASELSHAGKINGFKPITTRAQLVEVVAMIVFTASAQHAAVNYPQKQLMTYAPFYAGADGAPAPQQVLGATEQDWLELLPSVFGSVVQLYFLSLLGSIYYRPLGEYRTNVFPYPQAITDPRIAAKGGPLERFQSALQAAELTINARNQSRVHPYEYLLPSNIPTSTNI